MTTLAVKTPVPSLRRILYRSGYKYQLHQTYVIQLDQIRAPRQQDITGQFIELTTSGLLTIKSGYAWDGASGPTRDTPSAMRGSLVHDALYQLMRQRVLPLSWREAADEQFKRLLQEDGMWFPRMRVWWRSVRIFAKRSASGHDRTVHAAP